ncbi:DUF4304 domain-containing protein [Paenibacillus sp. TSA_86.1]|uniref:DUF4304 domain-containing protein n=1 Tax=Paenibacillus sp. TSA_86.1 TaxID=3415649 RepID=UPI0040452BEC
MARQGYSKKDLNFRKAEGHLIYKFNIQKAKYNIVSQVQFYINCMIHSTELAELRIVAPSGVVLEEQSHFTCRIADIVPSAPDQYSLMPEIDRAIFSKSLLSHLEEAD